MTHRIAHIHFTPRTDGGVIECSCGTNIQDDTDLSAAFKAHRTEHGVTGGNGLSNLKAAEIALEATVWNRGPRKVLRASAA